MGLLTAAVSSLYKPACFGALAQSRVTSEKKASETEMDMVNSSILS